jgi:hypothetical protein
MKNKGRGIKITTTFLKIILYENGDDVKCKRLK